MPLIQSTISVDSSVASPQGSSSRGATSPGLSPLSPLTPGHKGERDFLPFEKSFKEWLLFHLVSFKQKVLFVFLRQDLL